MSQATGGGQLQFVRKEAASARPLVGPRRRLPGRHAHGPRRRRARAAHPRRLRDPPVDTLIAKAQIGTLNQKDVHDIIALVKDLPLRETDDDLSICVPYLAETCAWDWGLYTDLTTNLRTVLDWLDDFGLNERERARVYGRVTAALEAIEDEEKPLSWRLRARVGTRVAWRREVECQDETPVVTTPD